MGSALIESPITLSNCRSCRAGDGQLVLDLGCQPLANNLLSSQEAARFEPRYPLRVFVCSKCGLLQISESVPPAELFTTYPYFSSYSETIVRHAREAACLHLVEFNLGPEHLVVEIGSNDGYLLKNVAAAGVPCFGIEPAANVAAVSRAQGIDTLVDFFSSDLAATLAKSGKRADLILVNNVLAHAVEINDFVAGLTKLLKPEGTIVLEFPYGCELVERGEFDTIYHEHVFYFTLTSLLALFDRHHLSMNHVERLSIHGGSLRVFAAHQGSGTAHPSIASLLNEEVRKGVKSGSYYADFDSRVRTVRSALLKLLRDLKGAPHSIAAYGASAKGSTLLNYCDIGADLLDFVADRSAAKQGRLTPGTHLPIVAESELLARQPDYVLLLTWNFADEILAQQSEYRRRGGRFIIPIPEITIV